MTILQLLNNLKILILLSNYSLVGLASMHYLKVQKTLVENQLALIITLWLPMKKDSSSYMHIIVCYKRQDLRKEEVCID